MAKRQRRITVGQSFPDETRKLINSECTLVKTDNSVIFVKVISVENGSITVRNTRGAVQTLSAGQIGEIIVDFYA